MIKSRKIGIAVALLWGIICFLFFQFFYPYHLFHREQMQLFLFEPGYLFSYFNKPAWLASLLGDFLTQFFYYIGGGAVTITLTLLVLIATGFWSLKKLFSGLPAFTIILLIASWEALRNTGVVYPLSATVALIGGFAIAGIGLSLKLKQTPRVFVNLLLLLIGYWIFGYGAWVALLLLLTGEFKNHFKIISVVYFAVLILPFLLRPHYLVPLRDAFQYPMNLFWNTPDLHEEEIFAMSIESDRGNWDEVLKTARKYDQNDQNATYYYNLASSHLNQLPENLLDYYQPGEYGLFLKLSYRSSFLSILFSNQAWFWVGDLTMSEHSTVLGQIFSYNQRSSRMVKRMAEINLIAGEEKAADKYLTMLEHTLCYRKWAQNRRPENQSEAFKKWIIRKRLNCSSVDTLRANNDVVASLRNLLDHNPTNKAARDYLLCFQLLSKNIDGFVADYNAYAKPLGTAPCELYTQALLISLARNNAGPKEYLAYKLDKSLVDDFWKYTELYKKRDSKSLGEEFKSSYWFYYHFATIKVGEG